MYDVCVECHVHRFPANVVEQLVVCVVLDQQLEALDVRVLKSFVEQGVTVVVLYVRVGALLEQNRETVGKALGAADVGGRVAFHISLVQADVEV